MATAAGRAGPSPEATPALPPVSGGSPRHRGLRRGPSRGQRGCGTALRTRSPVSAPSPSRTPSRHGGSRVPSPLPAPSRGRRLVTHSLRLNVDLPKWALGTSAPSSACRSSPSRQAPRSGPGRAATPARPPRSCPGAGGARGPASVTLWLWPRVTAGAEPASCPRSVNLGGFHASTNTALGLSKLNFFSLRKKKTHPAPSDCRKLSQASVGLMVSALACGQHCQGHLPAQALPARGRLRGFGSRIARTGERGFGARGEPAG